MRSQGLWIVAALLLGIGAGYVAGSQASASGGGPETSLESDPATTDDQPAPELLPATRPETAAGQPGRAAERALRGDGVIQGTVNDKEGRPVAGIVVIARPYLTWPFGRPGPGNIPPPVRTEAQAMAEAAEQARRSHGAMGRGVTDAAGTYVIEGLGAIRFWVQAYGRGYQLRQVHRGSPYGGIKPPATIDFTATAIVPVHVRVLGLDGEHVHEATVRANRSPKASRGGGMRLNAERDWLDLEPGAYWLTAVAGEEQELGSDLVPITVEPGGFPGPVTIQLKGRPGLIGTVVYGDALADVRGNVWAKRFETQEPPAAEDVRQDRKAVRGRMDRGGRGFRFEDLPPGRYQVVVEVNRRLPAASAVVEIRDRRETVEIEVPPLDREEFVPVFVMGAGGKPVLDARIDVSYEAPNVSLGGGGTSIRLQDGSYLASRRPRIPRGPAGRTRPTMDPAVGTFSMRISSRTHGRREITINPDAREIRVVLGEPIDVRVRFHGAAQSMVPPDARAYLREKVTTVGISAGGEGQPVVDVAGALFEQTQPGKRRLVIISPGAGSHEMRQILVLPFTVQPGKTDYDITLPDFHTLKVSGLPKGAELHCIDAGGNWVHQFVRQTTDGVAHFSHVAPGTYEVRARVDGKQKVMRVLMAPEDQTIPFK